MKFDLEKYAGPLRNAGSAILLLAAGLGAWTAQSENFGKWLQGPLKLLWSAAPDWFASALAGTLIAIVFATLATLLFLSGIKRSTLARRDVFNLGLDQLYGRKKDLAELVKLMSDNKLVLLTGESGVGKSALLSVGLLRELAKDSLFFPVYFNNYGKEWNRTIAQNLFHAIQGILTPEQRKALALPEIVDPTTVTITQMAELLRDIPAKLGKVPVLLFDQFDDYQLRFHDQFVAGQGAWQSPAAIRSANQCWDEIAKGLEAERLKVLFAARTDASTGLISVHFITPPASRPLFRPEDSLGPLLDGLTQDKGPDPVVKDPEHGWEQLKELLKDDLEEDGRVLPQEVKTALLGLRSLKYLTPAAYQRGGRAAGVKAAFVERAVKTVAVNQRIAEAIVLEIVKTMVVAAASEAREAKTEGRTIDQIRDRIAKGDTLSAEQVKDVLLGLADEEMVRERVDPASGTSLWQLDHDYLATAVLEMENRRKKWAVRLDQGAAAWRRAKGSLGGRWRTLLSPLEQVAILIVRLRGRLRYGANRGYAFASALRIVPLVVFAAAVGTAAFYVDEFFRNDAMSLKIESAIGVGMGEEVDQGEAEALLALAKAPHGVQDRVIDRMISTDGGANRAARRPLALVIAYAGIDDGRRNHLAEKLLDMAKRSTACPCLPDLVGLFASLKPSDGQAMRMLWFLLDASATGPLPGRVFFGTPVPYPALAPSTIDDTTRRDLTLRVRTNLDNLKDDAETTEKFLLGLLDRFPPKSDDDAALVAKTLWHRLESSSPENRETVARLLTKLLAERPALILPEWVSLAMASLHGPKSPEAYELASARIVAVMPKLGDQVGKVWQAVHVWQTSDGAGEEFVETILKAAGAKLGPHWQEIWLSALPEITNLKVSEGAARRWARILEATPAKGYSAVVKAYFNAALAAEDSSFVVTLGWQKWWILLEDGDQKKLVEEARRQLERVEAESSWKRAPASSYILALHLRDGHDLDEDTLKRLRKSLGLVLPTGNPIPHLWLTVADGLAPSSPPDHCDAIFRLLTASRFAGVDGGYPNLQKLAQRISAAEAARFFKDWGEWYLQGTFFIDDTKDGLVRTAEFAIAHLTAGDAAKHLRNLFRARIGGQRDDRIVGLLAARLNQEEARSLYSEALARLGSRGDGGDPNVLADVARKVGPRTGTFNNADFVKALKEAAAQARERKRFYDVRVLVEAIRVVAEGSAPAEGKAFKKTLTDDFHDDRAFDDFSARGPTVVALATSMDFLDCDVVSRVLRHPWTYTGDRSWLKFFNSEWPSLEGEQVWAKVAEWKGKCPGMGVAVR